MLHDARKRPEMYAVELKENKNGDGATELSCVVTYGNN